MLDYFCQTDYYWSLGFCWLGNLQKLGPFWWLHHLEAALAANSEAWIEWLNLKLQSQADSKGIFCTPHNRHAVSVSMIFARRKNIESSRVWTRNRGLTSELATSYLQNRRCYYICIEDRFVNRYIYENMKVS